MTSKLQRLICKRTRSHDTTDKLINEAERTRRELLRLTERLTAHVSQLQAFAQAYSRSQERADGG